MDSLRVRLMLLAALALLPLAALEFHNAEGRRAQAGAEAQQDALRMARVCADSEERRINAVDQMLAMVAETPGVKQLDAKSCVTQFARLVGGDEAYSNVGLADAAGHVVASAVPVDWPQPFQRSRFFNQALSRGRFAVSDFQIVGQRAEMMCADPVWSADGRVTSVLFAEIDLQWMADLGSRHVLPPVATAGVLRADGIILMRIPDPQKWVGKSALASPAAQTILTQRGSGTADEEGLDHVRRLFAFTPLDPIHGLNDYVSVGVPDDVAYHDARAAEILQLEVLGVFALLALGGAWLAADLLVVRGVRRLQRATQAVAAGKLGTRAGRVVGGKEFRGLAHAFDAMAATLEKQNQDRDATEQDLERRVAARTAELADANAKLQVEVAERTRMEAEQRAFVRNVPAILFSIDRDGVITRAEGRGMDVRQSVDGGIVGRTVQDLYGDNPGVVESVRRALAGEAFSTTMQMQRLFYEVAYTPVRDSAGAVTGVIGVAHDVTQRHEAEEALEASERRTRLIIENAYDAYVAMDREGMIVDWNPQAERIFGWRRHEVIGKSLADTIIPERLRAHHRDGLIHYLHFGEGPILNRRIEMSALRRDLWEFPVELTISTMQIENQVIFSAFIHDISSRIRAKEELEKTAAELRRSNEELEQFAYIASHDLQEPLRMVASYTQLLERRYAAQMDGTAREFIGFAVDGARRMQQFITGLLRYSRVGTETREPEGVNLAEVFDIAIANLRIAIEESGARVEARDLPVVIGDPRQMTQLFQNLIANALKFRKPGQPPNIQVWAERTGDFWQISVQDNGIGLDPKFAERVFVIFQRLHTREEYEGAGLGLAICKKIVERHGGVIRVESKEGEGATFTFTLPVLPLPPQ